ncbi:hypothetical protein AAG570_005842 [Ranatra chinensis]|uniref:C2H2-type domain-containing protein n=1 Tax=Ranatra chinensis TaxID=642074 RepID=A0ABD0XWA6_9HEMI
MANKSHSNDVTRSGGNENISKQRILTVPEFEVFGHVLNDPSSKTKFAGTNTATKDTQLAPYRQQKASSEIKFFNDRVKHRIDRVFRETKEAQLKQRRFRLKKLLQEENEIYIQEMKLIPQLMFNRKVAECLKKHEQLEKNKETADKLLLEEKLELLFRQNSVELRDYVSKQLKKDAAEVQKIQMQEKEIKKKLGKEQDKIVWPLIGATEIAQRETLEDIIKTTEKEKAKKHVEELRNQIANKKMFAEEHKRFKAKEMDELKELQESLKREDEHRLEKIKQDKIRLHNIMYNQMKESIERKKEQTDAQRKFDITYLQMSTDDAERDRKANAISKAKIKEEADNFLEVHNNLKKLRKQQDALTEEMQMKQRAEYEELRQQIEQKELEHREKFMKASEVLEDLKILEQKEKAWEKEMETLKEYTKKPLSQLTVQDQNGSQASGVARETRGNVGFEIVHTIGEDNVVADCLSRQVNAIEDVDAEYAERFLRGWLRDIAKHRGRIQKSVDIGEIYVDLSAIKDEPQSVERTDDAPIKTEPVFKEDEGSTLSGASTFLLSRATHSLIMVLVDPVSLPIHVTRAAVVVALPKFPPGGGWRSLPWVCSLRSLLYTDWQVHSRCLVLHVQPYMWVFLSAGVVEAVAYSPPAGLGCPIVVLLSDLARRTSKVVIRQDAYCSESSDLSGENGWAPLSLPLGRHSEERQTGKRKPINNKPPKKMVSDTQPCAHLSSRDAKHQKLPPKSHTPTEIRHRAARAVGSFQNVDGYSGTSRIANTAEFVCHHCGHEAESLGNMRRHMRQHRAEKKSVTDQPARADIKMERNVCVHGKRFVSDQYNSRTTGKAQLKKLKRTHTGEKKLSCDQCGFKISRKDHLEIHKRVNTGGKPFSCDQCDYTTSRLYDLKIHKRVHTGERPYSCKQCDYKSSQPSHLKIHMRVHTGEKPFSCDQCNFVTSYRCQLKNHRRVHTGEKPFSCDQCEYKTSYQTHLKVHKNVHTGITLTTDASQVALGAVLSQGVGVEERLVAFTNRKLTPEETRGLEAIARVVLAYNEAMHSSTGKRQREWKRPDPNPNRHN